MESPEVTILAVSGRAQAEAVRRSGFRVRVVDFFGDEDTRRLGPVWSLLAGGRPFSAAALVETALAVAARGGRGRLTYGANLENHPDLLDSLSRKYRILGNPAAVVREVREPRQVQRALAAAGLPAPRLWLPGEGSPLPEGGRWLCKPLAGGGGHGIYRFCREAPPAGYYLQEEIRGVTGSAAFLADGRRALLLGLSRQLGGRRGFGARGYTHTGNLYPLCGDGPAEGERLWRQAAEMAGLLTERFELRGWNGFDFVANDQGLWVTEVNPRYTASLEIVEEALGIPLFAWHLAACEGRLPEEGDPRLRPVAGRGPWLRPPAGEVWGKAVVYATGDWRLPDTTAWAAPVPGGEARRADIPAPGSRVAKGQPVCTVIARGGSGRTAYRRLLQAARALRKECMPCSSVPR